MKLSRRNLRTLIESVINEATDGIMPTDTASQIAGREIVQQAKSHTEYRERMIDAFSKDPSLPEAAPFLEVYFRGFLSAAATAQSGANSNFRDGLYPLLTGKGVQDIVTQLQRKLRDERDTLTVSILADLSDELEIFDMTDEEFRNAKSGQFRNPRKSIKNSATRKLADMYNGFLRAASNKGVQPEKLKHPDYVAGLIIDALYEYSGR